MTVTMTPAAAELITHTVRDYDVWRKGFDAHEPARRAAGILGHHVNRNVDHPNTVSIYLTAESAEQLSRFGASADLHDVMKRAGVIGEPTVTALVPLDVQVARRPSAAAIITHDVADYAVWKRVFDEHDAARKKAGIIGYAVSRRADRPNTIVIYLQADSLDQLKAFAASPDLQATERRAGVVGMPQVTFVQGLDWTAYS
jgi:quinol monooxygenase YgiN